MGDARWKLVMDQQGVTISSDRFQLTTTGPGGTANGLDADDAVFGDGDTGQMEAIISELEAMTQRSYGQFCGVSRALEIVGERWSLLIIRNLTVSPKTEADLQRGLPRIPAELQHARIIEERPDAEPVYELTEFGVQLDEILITVGRWGSQLLDNPRPEEIVTTDSLVMAVRSVFLPEAAKGVTASYEVLLGEIVFHAIVDDGTLTVTPGPLPGADMRLEPPVLAFKGLLSGELSAADAISDGTVRITGDPALLERFTEMFHIPGRAPSRY
jgi:DNA-binding HxlR family transcriptional regulator